MWDFGDLTTSSLMERNPDTSYIYKDTGTYSITLHVWTEHGCYDFITKESIVQVIESGKIEFPSAFTPGNPNGGAYSENDYNNDVFHPIVKGVDEYHLEIYNRWGVLVFESHDVKKGWDGYYMNKPDTKAREDVYIYRVYGTYNNGRKFDFAKDFLLIWK